MALRKETSTNTRKITVENARLIGAALEAIGRGKTVVLPLKGDSMRPLLKGGRDMARLCSVEIRKLKGESEFEAKLIQSDDVVLAEVEKGRYVLHRIIRVDGDRITLMGDGNRTPECCGREDVKAVAVSFCIGGRWYGARSPLLMFYSLVVLRIVRLARGLRGCLCRWSPRR